MSVPIQRCSRSQTAFAETSAPTLPLDDLTASSRLQSSAYADALSAALVEMRRAGLWLVPTGGGDGKKPLVKGWHARPLRPNDPCWRERFATANVGIVCGVSGLVVVDIDDPSAVGEMLERFGQTPLRVRTPRGGMHLYYRAHGIIGSSKIHSRDGRTVGDIKAGNAMVIAPPSVRPGGGTYTFEAGSWSDIARLPPFPTDAAQPRREGCRRASVTRLFSTMLCVRQIGATASRISSMS